MKRSEMVDILTEFLWKSNGDYGFVRIARKDAEDLLVLLEENNMFYCPVEKLGSLGTLRTPKGFEDE